MGTDTPPPPPPPEPETQAPEQKPVPDEHLLEEDQPELDESETPDEGDPGTPGSEEEAG